VTVHKKKPSTKKKKGVEKGNEKEQNRKKKSKVSILVRGKAFVKEVRRKDRKKILEKSPRAGKLKSQQKEITGLPFKKQQRASQRGGVWPTGEGGEKGLKILRKKGTKAERKTVQIRGNAGPGAGKGGAKRGTNPYGKGS